MRCPAQAGGECGFSGYLLCASVFWLNEARKAEDQENKARFAKFAWRYLAEAGIPPETIGSSEDELLEMMGVPKEIEEGTFISLLFVILSLPKLTQFNLIQLRH